MIQYQGPMSAFSGTAKQCADLSKAARRPIGDTAVAVTVIIIGAGLLSVVILNAAGALR